MPKCYLCQKELTKNNSTKEHIIPNALGGRLAAKILCKACNSKFGHSCDVDLAKSLKWFSYQVNHPRSHGKVQPVELELEGKKVIAHPGSGFVSKQEIIKTDEGSYEINILGNDKQKLEERALKLILDLYEKRGKSLTEEEIEKYKKTIDEGYSLIENPILKASLDFHNCWTGLLKIAINYAIYCGIDVSKLPKAVEALKINIEKTSAQYVNFYYPVETFPDQSDSIFHTLLLRGSSKEKVLYCLISLYGVLNAFVLLSDDYDGEDVHESYCYDVWNGKEKQYSFISDLTKEDIQSILDYSKEGREHNVEKMTEAMGAFLEFFKIEKCANDQEIGHAFLAFVEDQISQLVLTQADFMTKKELTNQIEKEVLQHKKSIFGVNLKDKQVNDLIRKIEKLPLLYDIYLKNKSVSLLSSSLSSFLGTDRFLNQVLILNTKELFFNEFREYLKNQISKNHPLHTHIQKLLKDDNFQENAFRVVWTYSRILSNAQRNRTNEEFTP